MTASTPRSAVARPGRRGCRRRRWRPRRTRPSTRAWTAPARRGSRSGSGEATTRRQPFSPRSSQTWPWSISAARLVLGQEAADRLGRPGRSPGSSASTRVRVTTVAVRPVEPAAGERGVERVHQREAEGGLGLGAAPVQRDRRHDGRGELVLDQQVADLRAVAVGEHDVDAGLDQVGDRRHRHRGRGLLVLDAGPPVGAGHGVAAQREQDPPCPDAEDPVRASRQAARANTSNCGQRPGDHVSGVANRRRVTGASARRRCSACISASSSGAGPSTGTPGATSPIGSGRTGESAAPHSRRQPVSWAEETA